MSKHTLGPWKVMHRSNQTGLKRTLIIGGAANLLLTEIRCPHVSAKENEANARLIAAAPDLLNACRAVLDYFDGLESGAYVDIDPLRALQRHGPLRFRLEPAIAKAEGRTDE